MTKVRNKYQLEVTITQMNNQKVNKTLQLFSVSTPKVSQIKSLFPVTIIIVIHFMGQEELSMSIALRLDGQKTKTWTTTRSTCPVN